jgi:FkbM family methyltransferase
MKALFVILLCLILAFGFNQTNEGFPDATNKHCLKHHISKEEICIPRQGGNWNKDFTKRFKTHETKTNTHILNILKETPRDSLIIDGGAHVGDTSIMIAIELKKLNNGSKVISIDPDITKLRFIEDVAKRNELTPFIETANFALSNHAVSGRKAELVKKSHAGAWRVKSADLSSEGKIPFTTLDDLSKKRGSFSNVYLIKLDIEGFEKRAIQGGQKTIKSSQPILILETDHDEANIQKELLKMNYVRTNISHMDDIFLPKKRQTTVPKDDKWTELSQKAFRKLRNVFL